MKEEAETMEIVEQLLEQVENHEKDKRKAEGEINRLQLALEEVARRMSTNDNRPGSSDDNCKRKCEEAEEEIKRLKRKLEEVERERKRILKKTDKEEYENKIQSERDRKQKEDLEKCSEQLDQCERRRKEEKSKFEKEILEARTDRDSERLKLEENESTAKQFETELKLMKKKLEGQQAKTHQ